MPADEAARVKARRDALLEQMRAIYALPPALKTEFDTLNAGYFAAIREAKQAEKARDNALANRKYAEAGDFERKAKAVQDRHRAAVRGEYEPLEREETALPSDWMRLEILITANGLLRTTRDPQITFRLSDQELKSRSTAFRVGFVQATVSNVDGGGGVNVGGVTVYRNRETLEALLSAVDRSRLQVVMQQPLPAEAAPIAWRVGKPPERAAEAASGATGAGAPVPAQAGATSAATSPAQQPAPPNAERRVEQAQPQSAPSAASSAAQSAERAKEVVNTLRGLLRF